MATRYDITEQAEGFTTVKNQLANIIIDPSEYAFLGNTSIVFKLRKDSTSGPVLLESPPITIIDTAKFLSVSSNTYVVPEGQFIECTVLTRDAAEGSLVYYTSEAMSGNITANDLILSNVSGIFGGPLVLRDDRATFTIFANVDTNINEAGEKFRIHIRAANSDGIILGSTPNITIKDTSEIYSVRVDSNVLLSGSNITFTLQTFGIEDGANLYYYTAGDTVTFDTVNASPNVGYVTTSSNIANIVLRPIDFSYDDKLIVLLIADANTNTLLSGSQSVNILGENAKFSNLTGGVEFISGSYKYHKFDTIEDATLFVNNIGILYPEINIAAIGAGSPGINLFGEGGGGGQVKDVLYTAPRSLIGTSAGVRAGYNSQSSWIIFSDGFNVTSAGGSGSTSGSNYRTSYGPTSQPGTGGGGGAGGPAIAGYLERSPPSSPLYSYISGAGGPGISIPWNHPSFGPGVYGGGGGGGAIPAQNHATVPSPRGGTGGGIGGYFSGGSSINNLAGLIFRGVNGCSGSAPGYSVGPNGPNDGRSYGGGGAGRSRYHLSGQFVFDGSCNIISTPVSLQVGLEGQGKNGAVLIRYRVLED